MSFCVKVKYNLITYKSQAVNFSIDSSTSPTVQQYAVPIRHQMITPKAPLFFFVEYNVL